MSTFLINECASCV